MFQSTLLYGERHKKTGNDLVNSGCNWTTKCLVVDVMWSPGVNINVNGVYSRQKEVIDTPVLFAYIP